MISGFCERTVRSYRKEFFDNKFKFKESRQGKQERLLVLSDENLRARAMEWVHEHAFRKGKPNMTAADFCEFVNSTLLPSHCLPPYFPRSISVRTAIRWLHHLGFRPMSHKKGVYIDGHEREDVVKYRGEYLKKLEDLESSHLPRPACCDEEMEVLPSDPSMKKLVLLYHDESIFSVNETQTWMWGTEDKPAILPKTKGSGLMVSDFIEEHSGYLCLTEDEIKVARRNDPNFPRQAREIFEYGAAREGYWTGEKFMSQIERAVKIAEHKYPSQANTLVWLFDQSSCHKAYASDALNTRSMNVKPGGAQPALRDTMWAGKVQKLVFSDGTPKGMKKILEERGINTSTLKAGDMRTILSNHYDFSNEKTVVEHFLFNRGHQVIFIPKFHCELNPIERVWGQAKRYTRSYTNFTLPGLKKIIEPALDSVTIDKIRKYFRKSRDYGRAYREGHEAGKMLENAVKKYKSHRRIFFEDQT